MTESVYVVTSTEMGWDCVCGVFKTLESAYRSCFQCGEDISLEEMIGLVENGDSPYVVTKQTLRD